MTTVIESVSEVQIFTNESDGVTILQKDEMGGDDALVAFPKSYIRAVIAALEAIERGDDDA